MNTTKSKLSGNMTVTTTSSLKKLIKRYKDALNSVETNPLKYTDGQIHALKQRLREINVEYQSMVKEEKGGFGV
ncbi:hypothetical protein SShM2_063 [Synechococcus phage S-ShM2]|uniref:Uncharacterized protein n=3 Tax=Ahtivirus sagseatwo TaxID=2734079 RepID=M4SPS0_9CAUD|nr:hypothetical protein SShM2_063 [Synechococcus phage S-ShM2]ADO97674.1 hypothetical protein SShM2_063 [Synechococcus phage S-ShM2]AGH57280.1 hypothetical protein CPLG_00026 [Cyanophage S-SSM2]